MELNKRSISRIIFGKKKKNLPNIRELNNTFPKTPYTKEEIKKELESILN